jgi:formyltetrahydrofolate-dependent phosphoribosylglycinamide formyltransferase
MTTRKRVAILISGRGSNMAALIAAASERDYPAEIVAVISNRADAPGLDLAARAGVQTRTVPRSEYPTREAHEGAITNVLEDAQAELICLAGYMRTLSPDFTARWHGRMINIHPSLLPTFPGLDTHARALDAGLRIHGCTVHFVTAQVDSGPIIAQAAVPVFPEDGEEALAARVLKAEHRLYPAALALLAEGKVRMEGGRTVYASFPVKGGPAETILSPDPVSANSDIEALARFTP